MSFFRDTKRAAQRTNKGVKEHQAEYGQTLEGIRAVGQTELIASVVRFD